jgi:paraquat-inducible protein B
MGAAVLVLAGLCFDGGVRPCAASPEPVQIAQDSGDVLDMAKEALGLGEKTPEGEASTGISNGVPFIVRFHDTVGDLQAGADVLLRGMSLGTVREVNISFDAAHARFDIPVTIELNPRPFVAGKSPDAAAASVRQAIAALVRAGLRAELAPANLFPGGLAVALEINPDAQPVQQQGVNAGLPEIPTTGLPFEPLTEKMDRLATRIAALPLEQTVAKLNSLIDAATHLVESPALATLLDNLAEGSAIVVPAAKQIDPTLKEMHALAGSSQELVGESRTLIKDTQPLIEDLTDALDQIGATARSMRALSDMLERQPQAILRGKGQ